MRITMLIPALHNGHLPPSSATRRSQFSQNLHVHRAPRQSLRSVPTNMLHNTVMVCLQQLALLVPTLRPTRWQQSVSTACPCRCRNCRRVGWAVARRCEFERQRRGSLLDWMLTPRMHRCQSSLIHCKTPRNISNNEFVHFSWLDDKADHCTHRHSCDLWVELCTPSQQLNTDWESRQHDALYSFPRCWSQCIRLLLFYSVIFSPSFSSHANSTPATSSVIFPSCKFQSCKFSYPHWKCSLFSEGLWQVHRDGQLYCSVLIAYILHFVCTSRQYPTLAP